MRKTIDIDPFMGINYQQGKNHAKDTTGTWPA